MDNERYQRYQQGKFEYFEHVCSHCGECCGSQDGDPCENLRRDSVTGRYFCSVYDTRLGPQKTVSGRFFNCVPIRDIIRQGLLRPGCAYNNVLTNDKNT